MSLVQTTKGWVWEGGGRRKSKYKFISTPSLLPLCYIIDWSLFLLNKIKQCNLMVSFCSFFTAQCWIKTYKEERVVFFLLITLYHLWLTVDIYFSDILVMLLLNVKKQSNLSHTVYGKLFHSSVNHNEFMSLLICHFNSNLFK